MTALVLRMVWTRWAQALTLLALSAFAVAAAVASVLAPDTVDRAVAAGEVARAPAAERMLTVARIHEGQLPASGDDFESAVTKAYDRPDFDRVYGAEFPVMGVEPGRLDTSRLAFRDRLCGHVVIVSGRCLTGGAEVVVGERTAERRSLVPGSSLNLSPATQVQTPGGGAYYVPAGLPVALTVVGVYRPTDAGEPYWGAGGFLSGALQEPVFVPRPALGRFDGKPMAVLQSVNLIVRPEAVTIERIGALRDEIIDLGRLEAKGDLSKLLDRIDRSRQLTLLVVPVAAIPLVVLCWFVIFLAVAYGLDARRSELGLLGLRGVWLPQRWWLAAGESLVAIAAGAPVGYLLGTAVVRIFAQGWWAGTADVQPAWYAAAAAGGAASVALLAHRRELSAGVLDLLRQVSRFGGRWRIVVPQAMVVALAVAGIVQLHTTGGRLTGVALLTPALLATAVALFGAALLPIAGRLGGAQLRRGRIGTGLAATAIARRPGAQQLFVLVAVATSLAVYAAAATDVGQRARRERAAVETGADAVVYVGTTTPARLLRATRAADPEGRFAMAVAIGNANGVEPARLFVDSTRLSRVAVWRPDFGPVSAAQAMALLRPAAALAVFADGESLVVDVTARYDRPGPPVRLLADLIVNGGGRTEVAFDALAAGRHRYTARLTGCGNGCRLGGFIAMSTQDGQATAELVVHEVSQERPDRVLLDSAALAGTGLSRTVQWRGGRGAVVSGIDSASPSTADGGGLRVAVDVPGRSGRATIRRADAPVAVPALGTVSDVSSVTGADGGALTVTGVADMHGLPRFGRREGILLDLEYASHAAESDQPVADTEVWLASNAPPDTVARLTAAGLTVTSASRASDLRAALDASGPARALSFYSVAAVLAVLVALGGLWLVVAVDRRIRVADLAALRVQGVSRRVVVQGLRRGYTAILLCALAAGLLGAAGAWVASGEYLPYFVDGASTVPPRWPAPLAVVVPWLAVGAVLVGLATVSAGWLARAVDRR